MQWNQGGTGSVPPPLSTADPGAEDKMQNCEFLSAAASGSSALGGWGDEGGSLTVSSVLPQAGV